MKAERGRPVITSGDHPEIIYGALLSSIRYHNAQVIDETSREEASRWCKTAQDSYESVQDAFGVGRDGLIEDWPDRGDATLYMTLDQLEFALVNYGYNAIEAGETSNAETCINELLCAIDGLKLTASR